MALRQLWTNAKDRSCKNLFTRRDNYTQYVLTCAQLFTPKSTYTKQVLDLIIKSCRTVLLVRRPAPGFRSERSVVSLLGGGGAICIGSS